MSDEQPKFKIEKQEAGRDLYVAEKITIQQPSEKIKLIFPSSPSLHNQTSPEPKFVGRKEMLETITGWYKNPEARIGALIGWGGVGKSALVRKWFDNLQKNKIKPDGIFWWGFYRNANLEQFLNTLLRYVTQGQIEPESIKSTWEKADRIKEYIYQGAYIIILDGLEQMQKSASEDEFGRMDHRELTELLHYFADAPKADGLCLITTRFLLRDLSEWHECGYENLSLIDLSISDSLLMLRSRGIKGSNEELREVIGRYKGHVLSLTSLAGYLNRYYDGDIKHAPKVKFVLSDKERFKDVNKLLRKYAEKMYESERIFLHVFSLFRQEVTEDDFAGIFQHEIEDTNFNNVLIKMNELDFRDLINGLVDWRLISYDETNKSYTTHPLIKSYFESDFDEKNKKLCHNRNYQYFGENAPERPETLEEMQPLFEQVYHGCHSGMYDKVLKDIYKAKIQRGEEYHLIHKLSSWETNIRIVQNFFPSRDMTKLPLLTDRCDQSYLLGEAGLSSAYTGRALLAEKCFGVMIEMDVEDGDLKESSIAYHNLSEVQIRIGKLSEAINSAIKAFEYSEKNKDKQMQSHSKSILAYGYFLRGEMEKADKLFAEANDLEKKVTGKELISIWGVQYAYFLLKYNRVGEASELNDKNLEFCIEYNSNDGISQCNCITGAVERLKRDFNKAGEHLERSLEISKNGSNIWIKVEALLERGRLRVDTGDLKGAITDAETVLEIINRTEFNLYRPDMEVLLSKAYLKLGDRDKARNFGESALNDASSMGSHWPKVEAEVIMKTLEV